MYLYYYLFVLLPQSHTRNSRISEVQWFRKQKRPGTIEIKEICSRKGHGTWFSVNLLHVKHFKEIIFGDIFIFLFIWCETKVMQSRLA